MNEPFQAALLAVYRATLRTGVLHTAWGYAAFERAYDVYKSAVEASFLKHLRHLVAPGHSVVDVGAHVGFFTERFASWVSDGGQVIALEPEPINFGRLRHRVTRNGLDARVRTFKVAATEMCGDFFLKVDPFHPGDHQLAEGGVPVEGTSLDALLARCQWPRVGLIKLDVQGAETRALMGARETLSRFKPVLLVEIDEMRLRRQGSSSRELLRLLEGAAYRPHHLSRKGPSACLAATDAERLVDRSAYTDFLFLPQLNAEA